MYIESVPNRNSPPVILLRESYRDGGKIRKRTLCNLSDWPTAHIEGLRLLLAGAMRHGRVRCVSRPASLVGYAAMSAAGPNKGGGFCPAAF